MFDVAELVGTVFFGLSALVIEDDEDAGDVILVRARTRDEPAGCPGCGTLTGRVHGYHDRTAADVPADGRRVLVKVRARRLRCPVVGCKVQTFREQVPGVLERYQRRTARLAGQVSAAARELAGRAGSRLLAVLGIGVSRHTALRTLLAIRLPDLEVPRVLGADDFALRRGLVYATILIDAGTGRRVDVLEGRTADVVGAWLREHPRVEIICRDGSGAYGEAVRSALPGAVQCGDRWHLWHNLGEAVRKEVAAHSACWARGIALQDGKRADTTWERWHEVHDLRSQNVGLMDCARPLGLSLNTVKRYDRASEPERLQRVPKYKPTLADYQGSSNLLVRYINQGRLDGDRPYLSPGQATRILLTRPARLTGGQAETLARIETACPEMTALARLVQDFAALLTPAPENEDKLQEWITSAREADLPDLHSFTRGLDLDIHAVTAALTLPYHNGKTEGVNTKTKLLKRQMYGRAGFALLRHRILLG